MSAKSIDYSGKKVYVGIDVHKKKYVITAICDGIAVKKASCPPKLLSLAQSFKKWFFGAQIFSAYEAGFSGFGLHRILEKEGIANIVVNPSSIEVASNDRVKTDKRDSQKISEQLAMGRLKGINIPSVQEELDRLLPRTRSQLVEQRSRVGVQIKSKLFQFSFLDSEDDRTTSNSFLEEIESWDLPSELRFCIALMITQWRELNQKIKTIDKEMQIQASKEPEIEAIYRSAPGVGPVSARTLATELGDMSRFKNIKGLFSYTGFTPSEFSSGEHVRRGHISRQGNAHLRAILVELAWRAIARDQNLRMFYERIKGRRGGKIAIVATARKLIGCLRACLRERTLFTMEIPSPSLSRA